MTRLPAVTRLPAAVDPFVLSAVRRREYRSGQPRRTMLEHLLQAGPAIAAGGAVQTVQQSADRETVQEGGGGGHPEVHLGDLPDQRHTCCRVSSCCCRECRLSSAASFRRRAAESCCLTVSVSCCAAAAWAVLCSSRPCSLHAGELCSEKMLAWQLTRYNEATGRTVVTWWQPYQLGLITSSTSLTAASIVSCMRCWAGLPH